MRLFTWDELREEVEEDLDMVEEEFLTAAEKIRAVNRAIDKVEQIVRMLHKDYFKTYDFVELVEGESDYEMPSDIYGNKLIASFYEDGARSYEVVPIKEDEIPFSQVGQDYRYDVTHGAAGGTVKYILYPPSRETDSTKLRRWYFRQANYVVDGESVIDIPEAHGLVKALLTEAFLKKDVGNPLYADAKAKVVEETQAFTSVMSVFRAQPDELEADFSAYEEHN